MKNKEDLEEIVQEIHYQVISGGFPMDSKLENYVLYTLAGLPKKDRDYLMYDLGVTVMQFCSNTVMRFPTKITYNRSDTAEKETVEEKIYICFVSDVCKQSKPKIIYTIAHQFAHAFLGHSYHCSEDSKCEYEADQQVIKWGFEKELIKSGISYSIPGHKNYSEIQAMIKRYETTLNQPCEES